MGDSRNTGFFNVFSDEAKVLSERRRRVASGELASARGHAVQAGKPQQAYRVVTVEERSPETGDREDIRRRARPADESYLIGLALSGGGVRSASFCLGALQGLDAARPDAEPQPLDVVDYLSTVSGGGFAGIALVSGLRETCGRFPFSSKLDQEESTETKHLRDYSNYLAPNGALDLAVGLLAVSRGLVVNAIAFLCFILAASAFTVGLNPVSTRLAEPLFFPSAPGMSADIFVWTKMSGLALGAAALVIVILSAGARNSIHWRERLNGLHLYLFLAWLVILAANIQVYVLQGLFEASEGTSASHNLVAGAMIGLNGLIGHGWPALLAAAAGLVASVGKLTGVIKATLGDRSWTGSAIRRISQVGILLAALVAPLLLWSLYLAVTYWGILAPCPIETGDAAICLQVDTHIPEWLKCLSVRTGWPFAGLYFAASAVLLCLSLFVRPNAGSLHAYYRDRLSRAFLWDLPALVAATAERRRVIGDTKADRLKFSELKPFHFTPDGTLAWDRSVGYAPYLLVNTAVNLEGSEELNRRGRNADNFIFSPLYVGSATTGYESSLRVEQLDTRINLPTAMAASGAAASANMGASTIKALTFTLSALNVRLGYWIPNPRRMADWTCHVPWWLNIGLPYFIRETFGLVNEKSANVYLTDGGHYDNLGLYELLRRRCKLIIAVDAEADPTMNFDSLVRLERYARIDLGVLIDLPWNGLKKHALQVTADSTRGPADPSFRTHGPHVAFGRIQYSREDCPQDSQEDSGVLIYIKASLSGDESDLIRDYKRRNAEFPHETTIDQFFSEEQFEVYRALGFHIVKELLDGGDDVASLDSALYRNWLDDLQTGLQRLNLSEAACKRILVKARTA